MTDAVSGRGFGLARFGASGPLIARFVPVRGRSYRDVTDGPPWIAGELGGHPMALSYEAWTDRVDAILWDRVGLGADDLPDWPQYDLWEAGTSPAKAAAVALINAGSY